MDFKNVFYDTNDFTITDNKLGKGVFGTVYVAERKKDHLKCAAKIINILTDIDGKDQMMIMRESFILSQLNHPSIVKYYGINFRSLKDMTKFSPTLITEYMPNKSLKKILENEEASVSPKNWSPTKKYICLLGISNAKKYLHEHEILHRDLKPENILMDEQFYPKVCDFGLSRCLPKLLSSSMKKSLTGKIGTPLYMAPEILDSDEENKIEYGKGVDVYAFAMLAYEIVTGKRPFSENGKDISLHKHYELVMNGERPKFREDVPKKMQELIQKCWSQKSEDRPSFKDIFNTLSSDFTFSPEDVEYDEINNYLEMINDNSNDKNQSKQEIDQFREQIEQLKQENDQFQEQIEQLKQENKSLKILVEQKFKENEELKDDQKNLNNNISKLQEQINQINLENTKEIKDLQILNEKLQEDIKIKEERLENLAETIDLQHQAIIKICDVPTDAATVALSFQNYQNSQQIIREDRSRRSLMPLANQPPK